LVTNGWANFEIPDKLNPSKPNYNAALVGVYDGTLQLTVGGFDPAYDSAYQTVPATPGVTYRLRVQSGVENWWWPRGEIRMIWLDAAATEISRNVVTNTAAIVANDVGLPYADWINIATAPVGATSLKVELADPVGTGSVYFDNAKLGVDYNGSTGTLAQVVNTAPSAGDISMGALSGIPATLQIIGGKHAPTDADNDLLTVTAVGAAANGTVTTDGTSVTYTSAGGFAGTNVFTYTVSDPWGGAVTRTVTVVVTGNGQGGQGFNRVSDLVNNGNGTGTIKYVGIPGLKYALEKTSSVESSDWTPVVTNTAGPTGQLNFTFDISGGQGYLRTRYVP
jgi:hypothetical protein